MLIGLGNIVDNIINILGGEIFHSVTLNKPEVGIEDLDVNLIKMNIQTMNV